MSKIQWTEKVWNPLRGCTRVSKGCMNCYAEGIAHRFSGPGLPYEGLTTEKGRWNGTIKLVPEKLDEPLRWRKPRRVFVNSMSDLFHEGVPDEYIAAVFGVMGASWSHTFQVLTKRPERAREWLTTTHERFDFVDEVYRQLEAGGSRLAEMGCGSCYEPPDWPLPNVLIGVSVEDQPTADDRIPLLLQCPAAKRFVSYEPALGPLDFYEIHHDNGSPCFGDDYAPPLDGLDWIIVGGESGSGAREFNAEWARSTIDQCRDAGVACFVKQLGSMPRLYEHELTGELYSSAAGPVYAVWPSLRDKKGGDMSEWPSDLRVREYPV